jgi:endonuclease/exonuclease/phosphatase family metal-dependent hydrolase
MPLLVRSWNIFHGRTYPSGRRAYLEEAIGLVTEDDPDVLCLQELPQWSLDRLEAWTGMAASTARTRHRLGRLGRRPTDVHHGFLRSSLTGQANAILVAKGLSVLDHRRRVLSGRLVEWPQERRVSHGVRVRGVSGEELVIVNLHLSHLGQGRPAEAELQTTVALAEELASGGEPIVLAGDFNLTSASHGMQELMAAGYSPPGPGIDHVLVRGAPSTALFVWPVERRTVDGRVLSDHPPVELEVAVRGS